MSQVLIDGLDFSLGPSLISDEIQVPITMIAHSFALFIIIKDTPKTMKEYRKYLIAAQIWLFWRDLTMSVLVRSIYFFPSWASGCIGTLSLVFHLDCHYQMTLVNFVTGMAFSALTSLMIYRRNQMTPPGKYQFSHQSQIFFHVIGHIFQLAATLIFFFGGLQTKSVETLDPRFSSFTTTMYAPSIFLTIWFMCMFFTGFWTLIFSIMFLFSIFVQLTQMSDGMSAKTFEMQKAFSNTLLTQLAATIICFMLPIAAIILGLFFHLNISILQYISIVPTYFSIIYSFILLGKTPVYRDAVIAKFWRNEAKNQKVRRIKTSN